MMLETQRKYRIVWWLMVMVAALYAAHSAHATDRDKGDVDVDVDVTTTTDTVVNTGGTEVTTGDVSLNNDIAGDSVKSLALVNSLGDVDIAACLGSTQWATPVFSKQKLTLNQVCMAEFYLRNAKYELAAMALCNIPEILKEFETEDECEVAHDFTPAPAAEPTSNETHVPTDMFYQQEQLYDEQFDQLESRLAKLEQKPEPRPRPVAVVQQAPQKPPFDADAVWAAWKGVDEDE